MRKAHKLNSTAGTRTPQLAIFFDTETNQVDLPNGQVHHTLKLGHAIRARSSITRYLVKNAEYRIDTVDRFWNRVESWLRDRTTTYLVAHNLVFDLVVLDGINQLHNRGWKLDSFYSKSMVSLFRWSKGTKKLVGMDNGNLFVGKLAKWGDQVGLPKLDVDFKTVDDDELYTYCIRDVEIMVRLWRLWLEFLSRNKCGNFSLTTASTSFNTYRHRFMNNDIYIHDNQEVLELERNSYRGGRVEALFQGTKEDGQFYYLDVNSLYPFVLKEHKYPASLVKHHKSVSIELLRRKLKTYSVIANVDLHISESVFPYKHNNKTCYPTGKFSTTLTTGELLYALSLDAIIAINEIAWYKQADLFSEFVTYFYNLRLQYKKSGNIQFATICKLLMNSLYGKFGQRGFELSIFGETDNSDIKRETVIDIDNHTKYDLIYLANQIYKEERTGEAYNSFPAIAAHVTAYARMYLYSMVSLVDKKHLFYMDTDCLVVDQIGYNKLAQFIDNDRLGALKVELTSTWLTINAPKDYAMQGRKRIKGVKENAVEIEPGVYEQTQFIRLSGLIQSGDIGRFTTKTIIKHLKREIYSGQVTKSGFVVPFVLSE